MPKIGFLFDLDGTLIDSQQAVTDSWTTVAIEAGIPPRTSAANIPFPESAVTFDQVDRGKP